MLLKLGDQSYKVAEMQFLLKSVFKFKLKYTSEFSSDGNFDQATAKAVKTFQEKVNLPVTGECDRHTWDKLQQVAGRGKRQALGSRKFPKAYFLVPRA